MTTTLKECELNIHRDDFRTQPFVLTRDIVIALVEAFRGHIGSVSLRATCADSISRDFTSIEELDAFDNPMRKAIHKLVISAHSPARDLSASVRFDSDASSNIYVSLDGDELSIEPVNAVVENQLEALQPWYAVIARADFTLWLFGLLVLGYLGIVVAVATGIVAVHPSSSEGDSEIVGQAIGLAIGLAPFGLGYVFNRMRSALFPMSVFALGQGDKRFRDRELLRNVVVIAFVVSVAASLVASWILRAA